MKRYNLIQFIFAFLLLAIMQGCPSTATKLSSIKADYNAGRYEAIIASTPPKGKYNADEVIIEAQKDNDVLTATQARIIKARALVYSQVVEGKLPKEICDSSNFKQSVAIIRELNASRPLEWMQIESTATVADTHAYCGHPASTFYAYDYMLSHFDFKGQSLLLQRYATRWFEYYLVAKEDPLYEEMVLKKYTATYKQLKKKYPNNTFFIYSDILSLISEKRLHEAVQQLMLAHSFRIKGSAKNSLIAKLNTKLCFALKQAKAQEKQGESKKEPTRHLSRMYKDFLTEWGIDTPECIKVIDQ